MFICGNDANAKRVVTQFLDQFGWDTEDMGAVEAARAIEPLCMLLVHPGNRQRRLVAARVQVVGRWRCSCSRATRISTSSINTWTPKARCSGRCCAWRPVKQRPRSPCGLSMAPLTAKRRTPMGARFLIADRGRRCSSRSRGSLISAAIQRSSSRLLAGTKFFERIAAGKRCRKASVAFTRRKRQGKSSRPRAQAGSTHLRGLLPLGR